MNESTLNKWPYIFCCYYKTASCTLGIYFCVSLCICKLQINAHLCAHLRAMCSSKNPSTADKRTTTERSTVNYETNLPWELTTDCRASTSDTIGLYIQGHMDFSSELCNAQKHISMQQQKVYVRADNNKSDNYW